MNYFLVRFEITFASIDRFKASVDQTYQLVNLKFLFTFLMFYTLLRKQSITNK